MLEWLYTWIFHPNAPAWVQAIGSVVAIGATFAIFAISASKMNNQHRKERSMGCVLIVVSLFGLLGAAPETVWRNIKIANPCVDETSDSSVLLHVTITNLENRADRLLRASTPVATKVVIW
jgi:hypothetical protein